MATTDVSAVHTSSLLASLQDFQNRFNNDTRVKKLIKGWNRFLKVDGTDTGEIYTLTIQDLAVTNIEAGCTLADDDEKVIALQASQEALVRIFTGKYNPAHALIDGALAVFSGERDKVKLEAIAMIIWGM
ncbi:MAG: SCP2 sterol-binding domain-containing protein [Acidobacteriia bacterium]|nr:SCP2 sterol-binding domain-containing protein [Terriglobia bacterium]